MATFRLSCSTFILVALGTTNNVFAHDEVISALEETVVKADAIDNSAKAANEAKQNALNAKTIIDAAQLNQFGDQPLGDALRRVAGVSFDGANRAREIRLRNIGREYTQVLINGRRILDGNADRAIQVDRIPSSLVERIEINKAPLASMDAQGVAGTVNIILKQGVNKPIANEVSIGAGYLEGVGGLADGTFLYGISDDVVKLSLSGGVQQQRRSEASDEYTHTGTGARNGGSIKEEVRRFDQINLTPRVDMQVSEKDSLVFEPSYLKTTEYRDQNGHRLIANQTAFDRHEPEKRERVRENIGLYSAWQHTFNDDADIKASLDWQSASEDTIRNGYRFNGANVLQQTRYRKADIDMSLLRAELAGRFKVGSHSLSVGLVSSEEKRDEDNLDITNGVVDAANRSRRYKVGEQIYSAYLQDSFSLFEGNRITVGLRGEKSSTKLTDFFGDSQTKDKLIWLPSLNVVQALQEDLDIRAGIAKTLRRPSLRDLSPSIVTNGGTIASPDTAGNPNVIPETAWGLDIGIDKYLFNKRGLLSAGAFQRNFSDKLESLTGLENGRYVSRLQNGGDGHMYGLELDARVPLDFLNMQNVSVWSNLTRVYTRIKDESTGERREVWEQPDYVGNLGLDVFVPRIKTTFGISANYSSGYDQKYRLAAGGYRGAKLESMTRVDLSARTELTPRWLLSASVLNVLSQKEHRVDSTYNNNGQLNAYTRAIEPTYRSMYVRLTYLF
ncbi:iron complex outermembrane recepter protein [Methylobacillus rhizosphaerae]|uniref:Iron complex outermembrane recepter protein n=1 Tax=Methylobacillus rhizosphaerae TaxID=551994 RepID=A0A238ZKS1_9PROT|nr:TonB-dependent receptor [Methylobacillus rhizosphaerae]SNR83578.1 iron complex outermembrane recepter protein [Methylobacillus rhizosphaerae]